MSYKRADAVLAAQIGAEANNSNLALDRLKTTRRRRGRRDLITQALSASQRGLQELMDEPLVTDTRAYVADTLERHRFNAYAVAEELRLDKKNIRWFVKAECQLLLAEGLSTELVAVIERDMLSTLEAPLSGPPDSLKERLEYLSFRIAEDLERLEYEGERAEMYRHIASALGVLGGCAVVAADTAAAVGTSGAAAAALAVSVPVGTEMLSRALSEGTED